MKSSFKGIFLGDDNPLLAILANSSNFPSQVYKTYIDVIHFRKNDKRKLHERDTDSQVTFTPERVEYLTELSKMSDIYERLSKAIAPSIYENADIKKGLLLQVFGGNYSFIPTCHIASYCLREYNNQ